MKKNLVISLIKGYTYFHVKVFVESIRKHIPDADICLFYHHSTPRRTISQLREQEVLLEEFNLRKPFWSSMQESLVSSVPPGLNIYQLRHVLFRGYLERANHYDQVFVADARDIVFQKNIFEYEFEQDLVFFVEDRKILDCSLNSSWVSDQFGQAITEQIGDNPIACAGTTLGKAEAVQSYLCKMTDLACSIENPVMDQGIHNYLIYGNQFSIPVRTFGNADGPLCTMHHTADYPMQNGLVVNKKGEPYSVLHQYDRHKELKRRFEGEYFGSRVAYLYQSMDSKFRNFWARRKAASAGC